MKDEKKYFNQLLHLIDIDRMLHSERKPTLKEMSEKLGVDGRTVSRYLRAMKDTKEAVNRLPPGTFSTSAVRLHGTAG